ncbi:MAG: oligosaccharide flippase family protein [Syntrophales bacterium]|jgi:O-antigen/teichoic acid export membrane protein
MLDQQSSYRQIMKATSFFGGVQVFNIIIAIIRSKFIAILLRPAGMGIVGLLTSTTGLIGSLTNFGLSTSAVKNVAAANGTGNQTSIATTITVLRRFVWITGTLGALVTAMLSPWLSELTFGNRDYTMAFIWISITLLFNQVSVGQMVVLQGLRKMQYLAKASLSGSALGLVITVPLYYRYGFDAIVPVIIIASLVSLFFSWYFSRKVKIEPVKVSRIRTLAEGKNMLTMGFMINLSGLIGLGTAYIVRIYISNTGGLADVGLYTAGFAIINGYVGLIFTAMGTDYYPRLSAVAHSNELCKQTMNQQAEIAILILAPIILIFLVFINWIVIILYSNQFIPVNDMILWAALGMLFRAASWTMGFQILAKGAGNLYFWNALLTEAYFFSFNILGYKYCGLTGLGISFTIAYACNVIHAYLVCSIKYQFTFDPVFIRLFTFQLSLATVCFLLIKIIVSPYSYLFGSVLIIISALYSWRELDKRMGLKEIIIGIRNRY